jgi:AsmA protein
MIALVGAVIAALLNLNSLIKRNKDFLIGKAEQALARRISVGDVEATLLSGIGVRLTDFVMADDRDFSSGDFVRARDLQVNLKLWPLLKKEIQVKSVVLHDPTIQIIRDAGGNFNFATIGKRDKEKKPSAEKDQKERAPGTERDRSAFLVALLNISGGDVHYVDKHDGSDLRVRQIDLKVEDFDFDEPVSVKLAAALFADKQNVKLASKVGPLGSSGDFSRVPLDGELEVDSLDLGQLNKALPRLRKSLPKNLGLDGVFGVKNLKFTGTLKDMGLSGQVEGTGGALRYGEGFHKPAGIPLMLAMDARYAGDRLTVRKGRLTLHNLNLAAAGDIRFGDATAVNLSVDSEPAQLDGWEKLLPALARYRMSGTMAVKATVRGRAGDGTVPQIQGLLTVKNASVNPPDLPKPIEKLDTRVNFTGQRADVQEMSLNLGKSRIRLAAAVEKFSPLTLSYKMSTPEIWPADYTASLPPERKADVIRNLQSEGRLTMAGEAMVYEGKLRSADGTLYNVAYKGLDATLSLADKIANIRSFKVNALNGSVQMQGEYVFKEPAPRFSLASKFQGVDVKELYAALDPKAERDVRGRLNADMKLSGAGKSWEEIKPALRGEGEAEVVQGALLNFNIADSALGGITGIPGLTNAFSPALKKKYPETFTAKDTEFKELKATFNLADGRMNVKNLRMAAAEFTVVGDGWADFNRRVNFRSTVNFSQRLSADLAQSAREIKYLLNNQGQLEMPIVLDGTMPNVKPRPDTKYLAQMMQRGFTRKGVEELQDRFLGRKPSSPAQESAPAEDKKSKKRSTRDLIREGLKGLFQR